MIFDCDGTLVDSEPLSGAAWRRILAPHGYELTERDLAACVGRSYAHTHAYLARRAGLPDAATVWARYSRELFALIDTELRRFPDAIAAVRDLQARGVPVAVASSSVRERLDRTLAAAGLAFAVTVAGDEVEHGKPAPDMYLAAAKKLGVERCVAVEDSAPGVASARAAGMPVLGVRRDALSDLSSATCIVDRVSADAILALLPRP